MSKKILITYAYMVKHGGASRVISEIITRSKHGACIELFCLKNNIFNHKNAVCHVIELPHNGNTLSCNENILFSNRIREKYLTGNYIIHSFGVYDISPDIYSAHFCIAECFEKLRQLYDEATITAHYPDWQKMMLIEEEMMSNISSKKIISVSRQLVEDIKKHYPYNANCKIIPNASRFEDSLADRRNKLKYNQPIKIGFVGKELLRKGFIPLVRALKVISGEYKICLVTAGCKSELIEKYLNGALFQVETLGEIEIKESFYQNLDFFICPSIYEPFSL